MTFTVLSVLAYITCKTLQLSVFNKELLTETLVARYSRTTDTRVETTLTKFIMSGPVSTGMDDGVQTISVCKTIHPSDQLGLVPLWDGKLSAKLR